MLIDRIHILHNQTSGTYHPIAVVLLELEGHAFPDSHEEQWVLHQQGFPTLEDARKNIQDNPDFVQVKLHLDEALPWDGDVESLGRLRGQHQA